MDKKIFTAGDIAKLCGVSSRTIRFYDIKGLLKPVQYSDNGYRYYDEKSVEKLQRILMFKYLGLSLDEIQDVFEKEKTNKDNRKEYSKNILKEQKQSLIYKKDHIERLIEAVDMAENCNDDDEWDSLMKIIYILSEDDKRVVQYKSDDNLQKRINIHAYSTSDKEWMNWMFDNMNISSNMEILEAGCGNGTFWIRNAHNLPCNIHVILADYSFGMLEAAEKSLEKFCDEFNEKNIKFEFKQADANNFYINEGKYDIIMANHMMCYVINKNEFMNKIYNLLKPHGVFYCSCVGQNHMKELDELMKKYNKGLGDVGAKLVDSFGLENGKAQLERVFPMVERKIHDNNLIVDDAEVIYNYVYSISDEVADILNKSGAKLRSMIQDIIDKEGAMFIEKSTGMFICKKLI